MTHEEELAQLHNDILLATGQKRTTAYATGQNTPLILSTQVSPDLAERWHQVRNTRYAGLSTYALLRAIVSEWVTAQECDIANGVEPAEYR